MSGVSTWVEQRVDRIDWALNMNTRDFPSSDQFDHLVEVVIPAYLDQGIVAYGP